MAEAQFVIQLMQKQPHLTEQQDGRTGKGKQSAGYNAAQRVHVGSSSRLVTMFPRSTRYSSDLGFNRAILFDSTLLLTRLVGS